MKSILIILTLGIFVVPSCEHDTLNQNIDDNPSTPIDTSGCEGGLIDFQNEVLPILVSNCGMSDCHDANTAEDDIIIDSYINILFGEEDDLVVPYDPSESELYEVITEDPNYEDFMPPYPYTALTGTQVQLIYDWILQGAQNTSCTEDCDLTNVSFVADIQPIIDMSCKGCHSGISPSAGLSLLNYSEIRLAVENNHLWETINYDSAFSPMPENQQLNSCLIDKIGEWISMGMPNN